MRTIASLDIILDIPVQPLRENQSSSLNVVVTAKTDTQAALVRTSKSGPGRKPIEVVEQESELTKATYNVVKGNS